MNVITNDPEQAHRQFRSIFEHLPSITAYARRRGSLDPEGIAAEAMSIAWRRLSDVPRDDPRPWLFATARNLLLAEWRGRARLADGCDGEIPAGEQVPPEVGELDPAVSAALAALTAADREALLLVAWEDLSPQQAAASIGISPGAFRVRFHRARTRFRRALEAVPHTTRAIRMETRA